MNYRSKILYSLTCLAGLANAGSQPLFENSDFEKGDLTNWTAEGGAMIMQPTKGDQMQARKQGSTNIQGEYWIGTGEKYTGKEGRPGMKQGNVSIGRLVSKEFTVSKPYINFRIAGSDDHNGVGVNLIIDGQELMGTSSLKRGEIMSPISLDVRKYQGKKAQIVIFDQHQGHFGFVSVDDFQASKQANKTVLIPIKKPKLKNEWATFPEYKRVGYDQTLRPQFHFTSRIGWLNDPNGMVYSDGEWFMYFQHYAKGNANGPKSWGSSVSKNLMNWKQFDHAINPYDNVMWEGGNRHAIWSGSAVVDINNALGKQKADTKTLFALYTATHTNKDKQVEFFQGGMYSTDKGRTWTVINDGKPVIPHQKGRSGSQRDPRVFYYEPGGYYVTIMMVGGKDRAVRLWKSDDLLNWEFLSDISNKAAECIDMYTVAVDGNPNNMKWVIADAGTYYEVGYFDGRNWKGFGDRSPNNKSDKKKDRLKFDYGDSYYAAQVFNQGPDGRVVHIGWLSSKQSGYRPFLDAGMPFTQQMSIPAEITLKSTPEGIRMYRNPVAEIAEMYIKSHRFEKISTDQANAKLAQLDLELIDATFNFKATHNIDFHVRGLKISYDKEKQVLRFINSKRVEGEKAAHALGKRNKHPYRDNGIREIPTPSIDGKVKIRVLVDRASLEIFVNDGQAAASFVVVPDPANRKIRISGNTEFNSIEVNELASIWTNQ